MMKYSNMKIILLISAVFTSGSITSAAVIAKYDFNSSTNPFADVVNASELSAGEITKGTQIDLDDGRSTSSTAEGVGSYFARGTSIDGNSNVTSEAFANAQTDGIFLEFTLTPDASKSLNLTDLHLDVGRNSGNTVDMRLAVTSSLTGHNYGDVLTISTEGSTDAASLPNILESNLGGISTVSGGTGSWGAGDNTIVDLSSATFDNISTAITFRIYAFALDSSSTSNILRLDDIYVNGSVIPEPGTYALIAGCLSLAIVMIRRRQS